jgi:hypothetical protein
MFNFCLRGWLALEFRDRYVSLPESFSEVDEPSRAMGRFAFVQIDNGHVRAHSVDSSRVFDSLATVIWDDVLDQVCFETPDGRRWAELRVTAV